MFATDTPEARAARLAAQTGGPVALAASSRQARAEAEIARNALRTPEAQIAAAAGAGRLAALEKTGRFRADDAEARARYAQTARRVVELCMSDFNAHRPLNLDAATALDRIAQDMRLAETAAADVFQRDRSQNAAQLGPQALDLIGAARREGLAPVLAEPEPEADGDRWRTVEAMHASRTERAALDALDREDENRRRMGLPPVQRQAPASPVPSRARRIPEPSGFKLNAAGDALVPRYLNDADETLARSMGLPA